jgi:hypothetical protein
VLDRIEHDLRPCRCRERIINDVRDFTVLPAISGTLDGHAKRLCTTGIVEQYRILGNHVSYLIEISSPAKDDAPLEHRKVEPPGMAFPPLLVLFACSPETPRRRVGAE